MEIKVCIIEDHRSFREGLARLIDLTEGYTLVAAYADGDKIVERLRHCQPHVVLMDIQLPGINGIEAVQQIRKANLDVKIIIQTVFEDDDKIFAAICAGSNGYLLKNTPPAKYLEAIAEAYHGGAPITGSIATRVLALFKQQAAVEPEKMEPLSEREKEVLQHLVKGMSYKMIAAQCHISYDTVRFHMKNIYAKLHVVSMTEAVAKAIQHKLT